jgi:hypothetical protein
MLQPWIVGKNIECAKCERYNVTKNYRILLILGLDAFRRRS